MNLGEIMQKKGIVATNFEDIPVDENKVESQLEIEFFEKLLKLEERNASKKELYLFAKENGFLSEKHMNLWVGIKGEINDIEMNLERLIDIGEDTPCVVANIEKELEKKKEMMKSIKIPAYYRMVMRGLGLHDFTPYGEKIV